MHALEIVTDWKMLISVCDLNNSYIRTKPFTKIITSENIKEKNSKCTAFAIICQLFFEAKFRIVVCLVPCIKFCASFL